ncbi:septation protein SepH [Nocardioides gansuensis]|nr:septation protein SepH [Nocardioides gansuensis]
MAHLTLAGRSKDGKRLLLVDDRGTEHTLDIDAPLKAAVRGETTRLGQLEIQMESALRPRDIQARIRAGESPESVAQAAQTTVDRIMVYAGPVMDERAHVAQRAQTSSVRRKSGDTGARTLGQAVAAQLRAVNVDPDSVEWDAWRREDGRWTLSGAFTAGKRKGSATFSYDVRGNFVTLEDDDARWLVGDQPTRVEGPSRDDLEQARRRRLSAVPGDDADELPLGEDAIELVSPEPPRPEEPSAAETTLDLSETAGLGAEQPVEAFLDDDEPEAPREERAGEARASEPPARRPARKTRGRASVPSWDEIMFGGPGESGRS